MISVDNRAPAGLGRRAALKTAVLSGLAATLPACGRGFGGKGHFLGARYWVFYDN